MNKGMLLFLDSAIVALFLGLLSSVLFALDAPLALVGLSVIAGNIALLVPFIVRAYRSRKKGCR